MSQFPPCPLCDSPDIEKLSNRDTLTGTVSVLYCCRACACCAPPATWNLRRMQATIQVPQSCPDCGRTCVPPVSKRPFCPACGTEPFTRIKAKAGEVTSERMAFLRKNWTPGPAYTPEKAEYSLILELLDALDAKDGEIANAHLDGMVTGLRQMGMYEVKAQDQARDTIATWFPAEFPFLKPRV